MSNTEALLPERSKKLSIIIDDDAEPWNNAGNDENEEEEDDGEGPDKVSIWGFWSCVTFLLGSVCYAASGSARFWPGFEPVSMLGLASVALEFVGAFVFFISPPLDFCDAGARAFEKKLLLEGLSPRGSPKPTKKAKCLASLPWSTLAAVCFMLGGLFYMINSIVDGLTIFCELDIIENFTATCVKVEDINATSGYHKQRESWPEVLNDASVTAGAWIFLLSALLGLVDYYIGIKMDQRDAPDQLRFICCCSPSTNSDLPKPALKSWANIDWLFYGTILFIVVSLSEVLNAVPFNYSELQNFVNGFLWTLDSLVFLIDFFAWEGCFCCSTGGDGDDEKNSNSLGPEISERSTTISVHKI